jgi:hypothetical protein
MDEFIHICTDKFPPLEGEAQDALNGMWGKALCNYLRGQLSRLDYECSDPYSEDWGWAMLASSDGVSTMVCVYSDVNQGDDPRDYAITTDSPARQWSWRKLRHINTLPYKEWGARFRETLLTIFGDDDEVEFIGLTKEFPLG